MTASGITSLVIAGAALIVAVWTRLGARSDARKARAAAERSAAAAERADRRGEEAATAIAVSWSVEPSGLATSELVNNGPAAAYRVAVQLSPKTPGGPPVGWGEWPVVLGGSAVPESLTLTGRNPDGCVKVTWQLRDENSTERRSAVLALLPRSG